MNIRHRFALAVLTIGITVSSVGCSFVADTPVTPSPEISASATPEPVISAAADVKIPIVKSFVETTPPPLPTVQEIPVAEPVAPVAGAAKAPVAAKAQVAPPVAAKAPVAAAPAAAAKAPAPAPAVAPAPGVSREVYVGLSGGQGVVDLQRGPVLFSLPAGYPPYVVEHDLGGGWARFGSLGAGMTVRMSGIVTGTYTVGQIINVPKYGTTAEFRKFGTTPKVMLQTCIPGTSRMIIIGLY